MISKINLEKFDHTKCIKKLQFEWLGLSFNQKEPKQISRQRKEHFSKALTVLTYNFFEWSLHTTITKAIKWKEYSHLQLTQKPKHAT
jgi:hypothetical protein